MLLNIASLKFFARPVDAFAPYRPPSIPASRPKSAAAIMTDPTL